MHHKLPLPALALLGLSTAQLLANDIEPSKEFYSAYRAGGAITIDGNLSDWVGVPVLSDPRFSICPGAEGTGAAEGCGDSGDLVLFERYMGGDWTGPDDHTSAVQVVWDADNIYFGVVVTDEYHENGAFSPWNGDSVQIMIANAARDTQEALYNYALGGVEGALAEVIIQSEAGRTGQPSPGETEAVITRDSTTKKTTYEIKIPVAALAAGMTGPLTSGVQIGLGMAINDGDEATPGQKGWGGLGVHALVYNGKDPTETALVTLATNLPGASDSIFLSAVNSGLSVFSFRATDKGAAIVDPATARLTIDGQIVPLVAGTKVGDAIDFTYTPSAPYPAGSDHTYSVEVKDTAGNTLTSSGTFRTPNYVALNEADKVTPDTTKPGFIWRVQQVESATTLPNSIARAENQLAGRLGDNIADPNMFGSAADVGTPGANAAAPIQFVIPGVINFSQIEGEANGNVAPDLAMPGIPGTFFTDDNIAGEVLTAVEFPAAGIYQIIVNSDDNFRTIFGKNLRSLFATPAGQFDNLAGRGATDTAFDIFVPSAGVYPMRTVWQEGNGGANIEILSVVDGVKVLLNDTATNPDALKTYQYLPTGDPAYVSSVTPAPGARPLIGPASVEAIIVDAGTQVTANSAALKLNGQTVASTSTKTGSETKVAHTTAGLEAGALYTVELTYTDTAGSHTNSWTFYAGPLAPGIFVVEAEDFDYDGGFSNPRAGEAGFDVNVMPYLGGAYDQLGAIEGIDYNNGDLLESDFYRTELDELFENEVNIAAANNIAGGNGAGGTIPIGSNDRGEYTLDSNYKIGWVAPGEWQNYTRVFPNNGMGGWWKVYAGLSHGQTLDGQLSGSLERVTSGVGTVDQTRELAGSFSAPGSGAWGNNNLVTMKNVSGADAVVKLTGTNTIRFNLTGGDFDFLIFSPAAPPPPFLASAPLDSVMPAEAILDWTLNDTDSQVDTSSVKVFVDGQDVTSSSTTTKDGAVTTIHLDLTGTTLAHGHRNWRITFSDNLTPPQASSAEGTFTVVPLTVPGIFAIEAEDFNYSVDGVTGGLTNPLKGQTGLDVDLAPYEGGAYDTLAAVEGVDYNNNDLLESDFYRSELDELGENEVNITASNGNRYSNTRGAYDLVNNYRIGWVESGSWQNYTRTFPANTYNVWAALSRDGRDPGQLSGSLELVTSDPAAPGQTVESLGSFSAPASGGWGRNELVLMQDAEGEVATVQMGGVQTIRFNLATADFDYLLFVPATVTPAGPQFTSVRRNANGSITVEWTGGGTLEAAADVDGPYVAVTGAASGYTFTPPANQTTMFARIRQ